MKDIENKDNYVYPDDQSSEVAKSENPIKRLLVSDLVGCVEGDADLSQNYKAELSKSLSEKYDYR